MSDRVSSRHKILVLGASAFIMVMANTMLFPVYPQMRRVLNVDLREISFMVLAVALPAAVLSPVGGYLADIWGRKKVMVPSILLYGAGGAMTGLSYYVFEEPFVPMLFFRILQGIGSAAPLYLAVVLAGDIFQQEEARTRAMGFIETANGMGKVLSPVVGGLLGTISWNAPFYMYPTVSFPVALALLLIIEEPADPEYSTLAEEVESCRRLLSWSHLLSLMAGLIAIFSMYGVMFWMGEHFEQIFGDGTVLQGLIVAIPVAAMILTTLFAYRLLNCTGLKFQLTLGLLLAAVCTGVIPFSIGSSLFWPFIVLLGVGVGLLLPTVDTIATAVSDWQHRGLVTTLFGSFRSLGAASAPYLIAVLLKHGLIISFVPVAGFMAAWSVLVMVTAKEEDLLPDQFRR